MLGQASSTGCLPLASQASPGSCGWATPLLQVCPLDCGSSIAPRMKCSESARSSKKVFIIIASPVQQCWDVLRREWFDANQNGTHVLRHVRATAAHTPHPYYIEACKISIVSMVLMFLDVFDQITWKGAEGSNLVCPGK